MEDGVFRVKEDKCPNCGKKLDAVSNIERRARGPKPGDITFCAYCSEALGWDKERNIIRFNIKLLSPVDQVRVLMYQATIRECIRERKREQAIRN